LVAACQSRKKCSKPAGEMTSRSRQGWSPAFQKVCHWSRGFEGELAGVGVDHLVAEQRSHAALEHEAVLVDAVVAVQRRAQRARRDRVLDQREAAARLLAPDQEAGVAAAQLGVVAVAGADLARTLGGVEAPQRLGERCGVDRESFR
jgi:hypothetical protein